MQIYTDLFNKINLYMGQGSIVLLFLCAFFFWMLQKEKGEKLRIYIRYLLIIVILSMNPLSLYIVDRSGNMDVYERFFWIFMTPLLIAFTFACLSQKKKGVILLGVVLILLCGNTVFTEIEYKKAENKEKISQEAIDISNLMMADYLGLDGPDEVIANEPLEGDGPYAMVTEPINEDIRMYNANIRLWYVRKDFGNFANFRFRKIASMLTMENEDIATKRVVRVMKKRGVNYLVLGNWQVLRDHPAKNRLQEIGRTENYVVYKLMKTPVWTVTQYADVNGYQCMCYTIEKNDGSLAIVDGGRAWQSETLVNLIKEKGGVVDTWIITHGHDDHSGVLASVLEAEWDKSQIQINRILIGEMDYESIKGQSPRSDAYGYLLMGLNQRENVTWLKAGDETEVLGLKMKVLHTMNDMVYENSDNYLNDGSMIFKLSGNKKSMLFLGDAADNSQEIHDSLLNPAEGSEIGKLLMEELVTNYKDDLPSTVVQMSHHGNGSMPDAFYELVHPKRAFFDAPDWLMENKNMESGENSYYSTPHYVKLMQDMGAKIISYSTKKRSVNLR